MRHTTPQRLALAVGAVQLFLALSWTVYFVYLPKLAVEASIAPGFLLWLMALDQLVIAACDWATGIWADRAGRTAGRIGKLMVAATVVSCGAFLALPFAAPDADSRIFLALIVLWSATSAALRAPPLVLIARHASQRSHPLLVALLLLGLGVAGAASPYLAELLREVDARVPFVLAAFALLAVTWALATAESAMPHDPGALEPPRAARGGALAWFLPAVLFFAGAFQIHVAVDMAPAYLRFAEPELLERLMPLFWIGFSLALVPGAALAKAWGAVLAVAFGAVIAAASAFVVAASTSLNTLIVAQLIAGVGWAVMLASALIVALSLGRMGAEGKFVGGLYSMLAIVTLARLGAIATGTIRMPDVAAALPWAPTVGWLLAAMVLLCMLAYGKARSA